jgi:hypothetical protein
MIHRSARPEVPRTECGVVALLRLAPGVRGGVLPGRHPTDQVEDRRPWERTTAGRPLSRLVDGPDGFAVHEVDTRGAERGEVVDPGGMSDVRRTYPWKDDHRDIRITDGFVRGGQRLVVRDAECELRDRVGRRRRNHATRKFWMRARFVGKPRLIADWEAGGLFDPRHLLAA